jgi:hypothetical protein
VKKCKFQAKAKKFEQSMKMFLSISLHVFFFFFLLFRFLIPVIFYLGLDLFTRKVVPVFSLLI